MPFRDVSEQEGGRAYRKRVVDSPLTKTFFWATLATMFALYTRQARTWGELGLDTLGPLDELLPEVRESIPQGLRARLANPLPHHRLGIVWAPMRAILGN